MSAFRERPSRCTASHGSCHVPATDASYLTPPRGASVPHAVSTGTTCLHADSQGVRLVHESFARTWNRVATHDVVEGSTTNLRRMTDCYGMNREILPLEYVFGHIPAVVLAQSPRFPPCGIAASNASRAANEARCIVTRHGAIKLGHAREKSDRDGSLPLTERPCPIATRFVRKPRGSLMLVPVDPICNPCPTARHRKAVSMACHFRPSRNRIRTRPPDPFYAG